MSPIEYDMIVLMEEGTYIAYCPELDISSCGDSIEKARAMLKTAVRLFLEEAEKAGTLNDILEESKFIRDAKGRWIPPRLIATEVMSLP